MQRQVNPVILAHLLHVAHGAPPHRQPLENLVFIEQTRKFLVDDGLVAQFRLLENQQVHFLTEIEFGYGQVQKPLDLGRGGNAARFLIFVHVYHVRFAFDHARFLLAERHQQILHQPPTQKRAGGIDRHHPQIRKLADLRQRLLGGGNEPVFRIQVHKRLDAVFGLAAFGHIAAGHQDFAIAATIQIKAEINCLDNFERIVSAYLYHVRIVWGWVAIFRRRRGNPENHVAKVTVLAGKPPAQKGSNKQTQGWFKRPRLNLSKIVSFGNLKPASTAHCWCYH